MRQDSHSLPDGAVLDDTPSGAVLDSPHDLPAGAALDEPVTVALGAGPTLGGSFLRGIEGAIVPTAASVAGFGPGAWAGGLAAAPVAALSGPLAPIVEGGGALVGGLVGAYGGGWLGAEAQRAALGAAPRAAQAIGLDDASRAADEAAHPYASFLGGMLPQAAFLRPGLEGFAPALVGGAVGLGSEGARESADGEGLDPIKLGASALGGALLQRPTALGRAFGMSAPISSDAQGGKASDAAPNSEGKPVAAKAGDVMVDPVSGKAVPAIDPDTGAAFYRWSDDGAGNRIPDYGVPDSAKATPTSSKPGRIVVDIDAGAAPASSTGSGGAAATAPAGNRDAVIDGAALRAAASNSAGEVNMAAAGQHLRTVANEALSKGASVTLHVDGKAIPITSPGLTDAEGQSWGAMPILTSEVGRNNRLEVSYPSEADVPTDLGHELPAGAAFNGPLHGEVVDDAGGLGPAASATPATALPPRETASASAAMGHELPPGSKLDGPTFDDEAIAASNASRPTAAGPFGPIHEDLRGNYPAALHRLLIDQAGEVPGALSHPAIGPIDLPWGEEGIGASDGYGLAKIARYHPEVVDDLHNIVRDMDVRQVTPNRVQLESADHKAGVRLDYDGDRKTWLLTAMRKNEAPASAVDRRADTGDRSSIDHGAAGNIVDDADPHNLPDGATLDAPNLAPRARAGRMADRATPEKIADTVRATDPRDVLPLPANAINDLDEAIRANPGTLRTEKAPDERDALPPYTVNGRTRRNPIDLIGWLRQNGGIRESGGELRHAGIDNAPRQIDFARDEGFLGKLVRDDGMPFDEAARAAWEVGFFPDHAERPDVSDFMDALQATHSGGSGRVFHPDDYGTLDTFYAARRQRGAVEKAEQEGSPLVRDIGKPITIDDLDANTPPATAYEDLPSLGGRAGNIALDKLTSREDIARALNTTDQRFGGFDAARRGRIAHAETEALASELNMTAADLVKRRPGQALNAEQALAARQILAKSGERLVRLARKATGGSDEDVAAFRQALVQHAAIQEQVAGLTAEAGRALAQFRMSADARAASPRAFAALNRTVIEAGGGRAAIEDAAGKIIDLSADPAKANSFARQAAKPGMGDKLSELYINSLLSGPQTHAANFLSNSLTAVLQIPEHAAAAAMGAVRFKSTDRVMPGEVPVRAFGMLQGAREGLGEFARTMRTGHTSDHTAKVESAEQEAISGLKGKAIRLPTRALSAADELFKGVARRMEINGLALRQARDEGLTGEALRQRMADLSAHPTDATLEKASDYARYLTFQKPLGEVGQAVSRVSNAKMLGLPLGKLVVPFVRTPANLLKFAAERSPMAPLLKDWRDDMMAGGARRDLATSKALLGSGMGLLFAQWAASGRITGSGPADPKELQALRATGWQPYSLRIGDRWYSYARLDPLSTTLGTAADLATKGDAMTHAQQQEATGVIAAAIINNLASKTWLSGVSDLVNMIEDPMRYGPSYLRNEAASIAVPGLLAQIARTADPVMRQSDTVIDAIRSRIPALSQGVQPRKTVFGDDVSRDHIGYGVDLASPIAVSDAKNDKTLSEVARLTAEPSMPSKQIGGVALTPSQYTMLVTKAGQPAKAALDRIVGTRAWEAMPDGAKVAIIRQIVGAFRSGARGQMIANDPALLRGVVQTKVQRALGRR